MIAATYRYRLRERERVQGSELGLETVVGVFFCRGADSCKKVPRQARM